MYGGGMLTGSEIYKEVLISERIMITDFISDHINPNSYDLEIGDQISSYKIRGMGDVDFLGTPYIDPKDPSNFKIETEAIPDNGFILMPGNVYLVPTKSIIGSDYFIPLVTGRSSIGRFGVQVHQEAGFGDIGFHGNWTFQITTTYPYKLYPNIRIGQVYFFSPVGDVVRKYNGKYQGSVGAVASRQCEDPELKS